MEEKFAKTLRLTASITMLAVLIGIVMIGQAGAATITVSPGSGSIQAVIKVRSIKHVIKGCENR